jgi:hypothetical membrane protein
VQCASACIGILGVIFITPTKLVILLHAIFLSDLGGYESHSGAVNFIAAFFFNTGMFLFVLVGVAFLYVPLLFKEDRVNYRLALVGSILFLVVPYFFLESG